MKNVFHPYVADKIFIIVLAILLLLPSLRINHDKKSITENRILAPYPSFITKGNKINDKFGIEYDKWFSDRFFGRNELIKLYGLQKNDIKGNLKVLSEKDNWLFYKGENSLRNFANLDTLNDNQLQRAASYISDIDNWCKKHKKQFILVIAPDKNKIYGEHIEQIIKVVPDSESRAMKLVKYLKKNTDAKVLYLYDTLIANKSNGLLYFKNDTHWNNYGAYIGYVAIMKTLNIKPITYKSTSTKTNPHGDLTNMATNIPEDNETVYIFPNINKTYTCNSLETTKGIICTNKHYTTNKSLFTLHDSFSEALIQYYANTFKTVDTRWRYNIQKNDLQYIKKNADIVILEIVERDISVLSAQHFPKD